MLFITSIVLQLRFTEAESRKIFQYIDVDRSGYMDYNEFIKLLDMTSESANVISRSLDDSRSIDNLMNQLRLRLEDELGSRTNVSKRLRDIFARIDHNKDNRISERELIDAFQDLRVYHLSYCINCLVLSERCL